MDRVEERPTQGNHKTCMGLYSYDALLDVMEGMEWKTVLEDWISVYTGRPKLPIIELLNQLKDPHPP